MGRLPTCYSPVRHFTRRPKPPFSCDLHVLGPPLTFALSQDQTLHLEKFVLRRTRRHDIRLYVSLALVRSPSRVHVPRLKLISSLLFSFQRPTCFPFGTAPSFEGNRLLPIGPEQVNSDFQESFRIRR